MAWSQNLGMSGFSKACMAEGLYAGILNALAECVGKR